MTRSKAYDKAYDLACEYAEKRNYVAFRKLENLCEQFGFFLCENDDGIAFEDEFIRF